HTFRECAEQEIKQVHEMNAVGKHHTAIAARAFEAAEMAAQHVHPAKIASLDGVAQPESGGVETEDVADLEDAVAAGRQSGEGVGLVIEQRQGFFDKDILAGLKKFPAERI